MTDYNETYIEIYSIEDERLENAVGGWTEVNQYDVKPGHIYTIYFPMQHGWDVMPYNGRSGNSYNICVYEVFEDDGILWGLFGTNRKIRGIDIDNGEYVEVRINCNNVYEFEKGNI